MGNEVIFDRYRDEDQGARVDIGRLIPSEYDQIEHLVQACADELAIPPVEVHKRVERMLEHTHGPSIFLVASVNRVVRGLCIAEVGNTANTDHVGWLRMEVHPDHRSQGLGTELLIRMIDVARMEGLKRLEITSYDRNYQGRRFFIRNGFEIEGKHFRARRDPMTDEYLDTYTLAYLL